MTATAPIARVGDRLPDFALPLLDGGTLALDDRRGKRLLLFFWGSW